MFRVALTGATLARFAVPFFPEIWVERPVLYGRNDAFDEVRGAPSAWSRTEPYCDDFVLLNEVSMEIFKPGSPIP